MTGSSQDRNFHAFKIGWACRAPRNNRFRKSVADILGSFNSLFGNREELVRRTGWSREQIDTIDFYKDSTVFFSLPRKDQLLPVVSSVYPDARLVPSGTYEMSELCPILVANRT
jgi:hypothetical protein